MLKGSQPFSWAMDFFVGDKLGWGSCRQAAWLYVPVSRTYTLYTAGVDVPENGSTYN